jgi:hypothetical protein
MHFSLGERGVAAYMIGAIVADAQALDGHRATGRPCTAE